MNKELRLMKKNYEPCFLVLGKNNGKSLWNDEDR